MPHPTLKDISRNNWNNAGQPATNADIQTGALQRIADATELMAKSYVQLQYDRDQYKRWYNEEMAKVAKLQRQVSSYQGIIKRLKGGKK